MQGEPDEECSLHEFFKEKIADLKRLLPELSDRSIIMHCVLELPEETRPHLQEGMSESIEMFLSMVEAVDFQFCRAKRSLENNEDDVSPRAKKAASETIEAPASSPLLQIPAATNTISGGSDSIRILLERMDKMETDQTTRREKSLARQELNLNTHINNTFNSPQFAELIRDIVDKQ